MTAQTTNTSAKAWSPDVSTFAPEDQIPDALVLSTATVLGRVEGDEPTVRVAYVDDAEAEFVPEGDEIDESDPELAEVEIHTGKVAQLIRLSREQWEQERTPENLAVSVRRAITKKANAAYLAQVAPTAPAVTPPTGLLHVPGLLDTFDDLVDNLDPLADAIAQIEENGGTVTHIIASPTAWGRLRKIKRGTGRADSLLGAGTNDLEKRLLSVPVLTTPAMPAGGLIVLDRAAVVAAVGELKIATSEHAFFKSDSIAIRATWRFGQNLVHPERVATLTVAAPTDDGE